MPEQTAYFVCFGGEPIVLTCSGSRENSIKAFLYARANSRHPDWESWERQGYTCIRHRLVTAERDQLAESEGQKGMWLDTLFAAFTEAGMPASFDSSDLPPSQTIRFLERLIQERDQLRVMAGLLEHATEFIRLPDGRPSVFRRFDYAKAEVAWGIMGSDDEYPTALAAIRAGMGWDREEGK